MAKTEIVRARIDAQVKEEASRILEQMGLTPSDGIRMFLTSVAKKKELPFHPFDFFEPNAETKGHGRARAGGGKYNHATVT